ncbi:MAG TPA: right-handed parallel beta-helix repeat-containing protein, partial [Chthoniobacterales bacterium]
SGATGKDTIRVTTIGPVLIDLRGFALTTATDRAAIVVPANSETIVIRNGTILANSGGTTTVAITGGNNVTCEDLTILGTGGLNLLALQSTGTVRRCRLSEGGISMTDGCAVVDSLVAATTNASISLGTDSTVTGVKFATNRGELRVGDRGRISDCEVIAGGQPTFLSNGNVVQTGSGALVRRCSVSAGNVGGSAIGVGAGSLVEGCRVLSAFREGITSNIQDNVTVVDCSVQGIGRRGIALGANARVRDCVVNGSGLDGILVEENSLVSGCTISDAHGAGIISSLDNVAVSRCVVRGSTGGPGISLVNGSVTDCDVSGTTGGAGIQVAQTCRVERNRSTNNGTTSPANPQDGLKVIGANNRIEGNQLINNAGIGLEITTSGSPNVNTGNLVIGNHARGNAVGQFSFSTGNATGPVLTTAQVATTTIPTANFGP